MPLAVSISVSSMMATRSRSTKSPVVAGRSTVMSVPKRLRRRSSSSVDLVVVDLDRVDRELECPRSRAARTRGARRPRSRAAGRPRSPSRSATRRCRPRAAEEAQLVLGDGGAVEAVEALVDRVLEHGGLADPLVDDGRRHLALAEARHVDLLGDVLVGVGDAGLELLGRHRDGELDARRAELLDRWSACVRSPVVWKFVSSLGRLVGATGFEPATSRSQSGRSSQAELRPESLTQLVDSPARARRSMRQRGWTPESLLHGQGARCGRPTRGLPATPVPGGDRRNDPRTGAVDDLPTRRSRVAECAHDRPHESHRRACDTPLARRSEPTRRHHALPGVLQQPVDDALRRVRARSRRARGRRAAPAVDGGLPGRAHASGAHPAHAHGAGGSRGVGRDPGDERAGRGAHGGD